MRAVARAAVVAALCGLAGCGEPLVDGDYRGEAMLALEGSVVLLSDYEASLGAEDEATPAALPSGELRLAVFWSTQGLEDAHAVDAISGVEQQAVTATAFPARYSMSLHRPPAAELVHQTEDYGEVAIGLLLVYVDADASGDWTPGADALVGGAPEQAILWSPELGFERVRAVDCQDERRQFEPQRSRTLDLLVDAHFPSEFLLDLDCDGDGDEWCDPEEPDVFCD